MATLALLGSTLLGSSVAVADIQPQDETQPTQVNSLSAGEVQELEDFWSDYEVPKTTQADLLSKLEQGKVWDSLDPETSPATTEELTVDSKNVVVETYPDGSIAVSSTSVPIQKTDAVSPQSVTNCKQGSGSNNYQIKYVGCKADVNFGLVRMGFNFDYTAYKGAHGVITRYYNQFNHIVGGALSNHRFSKMSQSQVRYSADFSVAFEGFPAGWTAWMQANVTGSKAWTTHN
ncbi:MAG: hypothetical protein ACTHW1_00500 [Ancrocorticia sp.]|uniref:hypothetical protein n=1 Tax=Ancrocorticia sp. TaxID=2593684 RepID=UPI003F8DA052